MVCFEYLLHEVDVHDQEQNFGLPAVDTRYLPKTATQWEELPQVADRQFIDKVRDRGAVLPELGTLSRSRQMKSYEGSTRSKSKRLEQLSALFRRDSFNVNCQVLVGFPRAMSR